MAAAIMPTRTTFGCTRAYVTDSDKKRIIYYIYICILDKTEKNNQMSIQLELSELVLATFPSDIY